MKDKPKVEQADGYSGWRGHAYLKRKQRRMERRRARKNPECNPYYGRYRGYEL